MTEPRNPLIERLQKKIPNLKLETKGLLDIQKALSDEARKIGEAALRRAVHGKRMQTVAHIAAMNEWVAELVSEMADQKLAVLDVGAPAEIYGAAPGGPDWSRVNEWADELHADRLAAIKDGRGRD